jgi:hypothetical protein
MTEKWFKINFTSTKSATVNSVMCRRPSNNFITEDKLLKAVYILNQIITKHSLNISS